MTTENTTKKTQHGAFIKISENTDGLDEVFATNATVHIEKMSADHWWMAIRTAEGDIAVEFHTRHRAKLNASWRPD